MKMGEFDLVVVGAGVFGATVAERLASAGKKVLVMDRREHVAGNAYSYTDPETKIEIHKYGSHIFHTEDEGVWEYVSRFTAFNDYVHTVKTRHGGKFYPIPINLDTINLLYDKDLTAEEAEKFVRAEAEAATRKMVITEARGELSEADIERKVREFQSRNFDEQGRFLVGDFLYETFLKGYTEKQWNTSAKKLSADILKRIPVRFSRDDRYFMTAKYQGIPVEGYTVMVKKMLTHENITVKLGVDFSEVAAEIPVTVPVVYCGQVDELLDYQLGVLPWRSLRFEEEWTDDDENALKLPVINEADADVPYTRTHYYKYYQIHQPEVIKQTKSYVCREYPANFERGGEAYYPVNNAESEDLYRKYVASLSEMHPNYILGGRLGAYRYWDMDVAIRKALDLAAKLTKKV